MRRLATVAILLVIIGSLFARNSGESAYKALVQDYSSGLISVDTYVENLIYSVKSPEQMSEEYRSLQTGRSGTLPLVEAYNYLEEVSEETLERLRPMMARPWGLTQSHTTTHFKFHYTLTGGDATTTTFVSQMAAAFEASWSHIVALGFATPPSDGSAGGDSRYDVYIRNLSAGILGYCEPEASVPGTPWNDATSFINMRNSYSAYSYTPLQLMQSTAVHEMFHGFQMGYNVGAAPWFFEVSSVWIEDDMYPTYNDEHSYLPVFFNNPEVTITTYNGSHEYGSYLLATYMVSEFGDETMHDIWEQCKWVNVTSAIQAVAADNGSSRNNVFKEFFQWNLFTGSRSALGHYAERALFPDIRIEDVVYPSEYPVTGGGSTRWPDHLASNYFQFNIPAGASGPFSITFDGQDGGVWSAQLIFPGVSSYAVMDIPLDAYGYGYVSIPDSIYSLFANIYMIVGQLSTSGTGWTFAYSAVFDTIIPTHNPPRNLVATSGVSGNVPLVWDPPIGGGTSGEEEIFYDDGTGVGYYPSTAFGSTDIIEYVMFTTTSPCTLKTVKFWPYSNSGTYSNVGIYVWGESGGISPGLEIGTMRTVMPTAGNWNNYNIYGEGIALPAGDFFIGIGRTGDGATGLLVDDTSTTGRSYAIVDDSLLYGLPSDLLLRAIVKIGARFFAIEPGSGLRPLEPYGGYEFAGYPDAPVIFDEPFYGGAPTYRPAEPPTNYKVYRSLTPGGPWTTVIGTPTAEEFTDMSVFDGTSYYYVVTAQYAGGESGPSNQASATPGGGGGSGDGYELIMNADTSAMSLGIWWADGWAEVLNVDRPAKLISLVYGIFTQGLGAYRPGLHHWQDNRIVGELLPRVEEPCGFAGDTGWTYYVYDVEDYDQYVNGSFVVSMKQHTGREFVVHQPIPSTENEFLYNDSLNFWFHPDTGVFYIGAIVEYVDSTERYRISGRVTLAGGTGGSPAPTDLSGSVVSIQSLGVSDTTDASGYFSIDSLQPGNYIVTASRIWYDPVATLVSVGNNIVQNFNLVPLNLPVKPPRFVSARSFQDGRVTLNWLGPVGSPGTNEWLVDWEPDSMYWYRSRLSAGSVECHKFDIWAPCTLKTVRIAFYDSTEIYDNIEFHIWPDDGSGYPDFSEEMITPVIISPTPYSPTAGITFTNINLDSLGRSFQLLPGDKIHVGVLHLTTHPSIIQDNSMPIDRPTPSKVYDASNGMWDVEMADFLIEAYVEYFAYAGRPMRPETEVAEIRRHNRHASLVPLGSTPRPRPMEGTTVDFYDIYRTDDLDDTTTFTLIASAPGDSNSWVDASVTNDRWWAYYIKTHQSHGISERSAYVMAYPKTYDPDALVMLVDDDGSSWAGGIDESWAYIKAMLDADIPFNGYDISTPYGDRPSLATLAAHEAVFWWTGILSSDSTTLTPADESLLENYLSAGGNLALFSQDYLWDRYRAGFSPSSFPAVQFGLDSVIQDNWNISNRQVAEFAGYYGGPFNSISMLISSPFGSFDLWPDRLYADSILAYVNNGTSSGPAVCGKKGLGFNTVFSTVPLSAMIDTTAPSTKQEFVMRILDDFFELFGPENVVITYNMTRGWNLVSLPVDIENNTAASVFPGRIGNVFTYDPSASDYVAADSIFPGKGYFVLYFADTTITHNAPPIYSLNTPLGRGWNQVGGIYSDSPVPFASAVFTPDFFITGNFFGWNGADYYNATSFEAGKGYWALTSNICNMSIGSGGKRRPEPDYSAMTLAFGNSELNFGIGERIIGYRPPTAPFQSSAPAYLVEEGLPCLISIKESGEWTLMLESSVELTVRNASGVRFFLNDGDKAIELTDGKTLALNSGTYKISSSALPSEFALRQAVPNPFNAATEIAFELPVEARVNIEIFDISGRKVRQLADGEFNPGIHRKVWDGRTDNGGDLPTGIYFYRLMTDSGFSQTRRMVLVK